MYMQVARQGGMHMLLHALLMDRCSMISSYMYISQLPHVTHVILFKRPVHEAVAAEFAKLIGACLKTGWWAIEHARL